MSDQREHGHWSANDEYRETPPGAGYEHTDADVGPIAKFMVWLAVLTVISCVAMGIMFTWMVNSRVETVTEQRYPLGEVDRGVPEPAGARLQTDPIGDLERFRTTEQRILESYGWIDEDAGVVRVPIDEAMREVVEAGLPVRDGDVADDPMAASGSRPSDASSGRSDAIRRQ